MNPSTGTFITMDEYAGSIFEPVSLHKYLYANANPVTYSDPTGYFSIGEISTSISIQNVLISMECGAVLGGILNSLLTALRGGTKEEIQQALLDGFVTGAFFGGAFGIVGYWAATYWQARLLLSAMEFTGGYYAFSGAFKDFISASNSEGLQAVGYLTAGIIETSLGFVGVFSSAGNFNIARNIKDSPTTISYGTDINFELKVSDKQIGKKWGEHKKQYPELKDYRDYEKLAQDIFTSYDKVVFDSECSEYYFIKGNNLLRVKETGDFVSLYPGADSSRVIKAIEREGVLR